MEDGNMGKELPENWNVSVRTMNVQEKLHILTDAAKYDVACTSSGVERKGNGTSVGNCVAAKSTSPAARAASRITPGNRRQTSPPRRRSPCPLLLKRTAPRRRCSSCTPTPPRTTAFLPGCGSPPGTGRAAPTAASICARWGYSSIVIRKTE